jgi:hypothetical protein
MANITIADFTNGSVTTSANGSKEWSGTGIFDVIMKAVNGNILVEYENGRIGGPDYSTVYLGSLQTAITAAIDFVLREKAIEEQIAASAADTAMKQAQSAADVAVKNADVAVKAAQVTKLTKDNEATEAQISLYERQEEGFDDNKYQKLLDTQMNAWALMFSSGMLGASALPAAISSAASTAVYKSLTGVEPGQADLVSTASAD